MSDIYNEFCGKQGCSVQAPHGHGTDAPEPQQCQHYRVDAIYAPPNGRWACKSCGALFVPFDADVAAALEGAEREQEVFGTALDAIAGMMSAVMFDYTERMAERYGIRGDDVRTEDTDEHKPESGEPHRYDDKGVCQDCGYTPFLGND
jgi:hypothetical protein